MYIYLDNAATTHVCPEVIEAMNRVLREYGGNPSSLHRPGREAEGLLSSSRESVAEVLGGKATEVCFTSGGTEANNWAIESAAHKSRHSGRHIIATGIEHDSVLRPLKFLESRGWEVTYLSPAKPDLLSQLKNALRDDTVLVTAMLVNNETGAILPIREMAEAVHKNSAALFHTDAVQGFMKIPFTVRSLGVDLLTVSAHKLHGPKGVGALWIKDGVKLSPLLRGGKQESGLRSGTESLHNIAGFAEAVRLAEPQMDSATRKFSELQTALRQTLSKALPRARILPADSPHIMSVSLPGYPGQVIMNYLDAKGIFVSTGSACKRGGRSHVLEAMGLSPEVAGGTIRVSFSRYNTVSEISRFCDALIEASKALLPKLR